MRLLLITTAVALAAGSALAQSIEAVVSGEAVNSSVASVSCAQLPAAADQEEGHLCGA